MRLTDDQVREFDETNYLFLPDVFSAESWRRAISSRQSSASGSTPDQYACGHSLYP